MFTAVAFPDLTVSDTDAAEASAAQTRGFAVGYAEGQRKAEQELAEQRAQLTAESEAIRMQSEARTALAVQAFDRAAAAVHAVVIPVAQEAEETVLAAGLQLAEAILGAELSDGETSATSAITRVFAHPSSAAIITVRMNPVDLSVIQDDPRVAGNDVEFRADPSLARGDAVATLPVGYIDATITTAVQRAQAELNGRAA
ncbi:FliH/SctL family protein [Leifsonia sp. Leaf264]|uniref:FliH/SctL family protein n=1 Tax=Leifsonia sp. Leaf264 TaxID=1736314 RepID=UPI0006F3F321|nr:FliH/SctL family protein [Leifsonia sp. Leaf264]KQO98234.1 hypothetical protein ASF30_09235 [Leifsonia sp. Leaf264]